MPCGAQVLLEPLLSLAGVRGTWPHMLTSELLKETLSQNKANNKL